jgi:hypothetical protein
MRHAQILRGGLWAILAVTVVGSAGCTHNYYYGAAPACPPVVAPAVVTAAPVCEVPAVVSGGAVAVRAPAQTTIINGVPVTTVPKPPSVVVSEPRRKRMFGNWRTPDPEADVATTRVEGAYEEPTSTR